MKNAVRAGRGTALSTLRERSMSMAGIGLLTALLVFAGAGGAWANQEVTFGVTGTDGTLTAASSVTGDNPMSSPATVSDGADITFTATPDAGYRVKAWTGITPTPAAFATTATITGISANANVTVEFELIPPTYTVTFGVTGTDGTLTAASSVTGDNPMSSPATVSNGADITFTATPDAGYRVKAWTGITPTPAAFATTATITGISANANVTVEFELIPSTHTVIFDVTGTNGTLTATSSVTGDNPMSSPATVSNGADITFTATPDAGYRVKAWTGITPTPAASATTATITNIASDASVTVEFELIPLVTHTVTFGVTGTDGTLTAASSVTGDNPMSSPATVSDGADITFTATPDAGYRVKAWTGISPTPAAFATTATITGISADANVTVEFELIPPTHTVTFGVTGTDGTLTAASSVTGDNPMSSPATVSSGADITFTATPDAGYRVKAWTGITPTPAAFATTATITGISANANVTVEFELIPPTHTVTFGVTGTDGTLTAASSVTGDNPMSSPATVSSGADITFTATPDAGYRVKAWTGITPTPAAFATTATITGISANASVTVEFELIPPTYTVTFGVTGTDGTLTAASSVTGDNPMSSPATVSNGADITFTATPDAGYRVKAWTGITPTPAAFATTATITGISANANVTVEFELIPPTHTVTFGVTGTDGTLTAASSVTGDNPMSSPATVSNGANITFTATPDAGYRVKAWTGISPTPAAFATTATITGISANANVTVEFELIPPTYTVTYGVTGTNGTLTAASSVTGDNPMSSPATVSNGADITFTATPDAGYRVKAWTGISPTPAAFATTATITGISANANVTVEFELIPPTYTVTFGVTGTNGTLTAASSVTGDNPMSSPATVSDGADITFTATPDAGYRVKAWTGITPTPAAFATTATITGISANANVTVEFELIPPTYTVTFGVTGTNGTLTAASSVTGDNPMSSPATVSDGADITFTATPDAGYRVKAWTGITPTPAASATTTTITGISANANVTVEFEAIPLGALAAAKAAVEAAQSANVGDVWTSVAQVHVNTKEAAEAYIDSLAGKTLFGATYAGITHSTVVSTNDWVADNSSTPGSFDYTLTLSDGSTNMPITGYVVINSSSQSELQAFVTQQTTKVITEIQSITTTSAGGSVFTTVNTSTNTTVTTSYTKLQTVSSSVADKAVPTVDFTNLNTTDMGNLNDYFEALLMAQLEENIPNNNVSVVTQTTVSTDYQARIDGTSAEPYGQLGYYQVTMSFKVNPEGDKIVFRVEDAPIPFPGSVAVGSATAPGVLDIVSGASVSYPVTTHTTVGPNGTFTLGSKTEAETKGSNKFFVDGLPSGVTPTLNTITGGSGTLTLTSTTTHTAGNHNLDLIINGIKTTVQFTLVIADPTVPTVVVGTQQNDLVKGVSADVTFPVTTTTAGLSGTFTLGTGAASTTTFKVDNLPSGVSANTNLVITNGSGTLTLSGGSATNVGTTSTLQLTINGVQTSTPFILTIRNPKTYKTPTVSFAVASTQQPLEYGTAGNVNLNFTVSSATDEVAISTMTVPDVTGKIGSAAQTLSSPGGTISTTTSPVSAVYNVTPVAAGNLDLAITVGTTTTLTFAASVPSFVDIGDTWDNVKCESGMATTTPLTYNATTKRCDVASTMSVSFATPAITPFVVVNKKTLIPGKVTVLKQYDGNSDVTDASVTVAVTGLLTGDVGKWVKGTGTGIGYTVNPNGATFDDKNVGTGKTITPTSMGPELILGSDLANYQIQSGSFTFSTGTIEKATLTLPQAPHATVTKEYDGTPTISGVATIAVSQPSGFVTGEESLWDPANYSVTTNKVFATPPNAGTTVSITAPSGAVTQTLSFGPELSNYTLAVTPAFALPANGEITKVTVNDDNKEYHMMINTTDHKVVSKAPTSLGGTDGVITTTWSKDPNDPYVEKETDYPGKAHENETYWTWFKIDNGGTNYNVMTSPLQLGDPITMTGDARITIGEQSKSVAAGIAGSTTFSVLLENWTNPPAKGVTTLTGTTNPSIKLATGATLPSTMTSGVTYSLSDIKVTNYNSSNGTYTAEAELTVTLTSSSTNLATNDLMLTYSTGTGAALCAASGTFTLTVNTISVTSPASRELRFRSLVAGTTIPPAEQKVVIGKSGTASTTLLFESTLGKDYLVRFGTMDPVHTALGGGGTLPLTGSSGEFFVRPAFDENWLGNYDDVIKISVVSANGDIVKNDEIAVYFDVFSGDEPHIDVSPASLSFGSLPSSSENPYTQPAAQSVTLINTGTKPITLDMPVDDYYEISLTSGGLSLPQNGSQVVFSVRPKAGLSEGVIYDTPIEVTGVSDGMSISALINVTFTVEDPNNYAIGASGLTTFGTMYYTDSYVPPNEQIVEVWNIGSGAGPITVSLPKPNPTDYVIAAYSASPKLWSSAGTVVLARGESAKFTVRPKAGLSGGAHNEEIIITGTSGSATCEAKINATFTLIPARTISATPPEWDFGVADEGYTWPTPDAQTVTVEIKNTSSESVTLTKPTLPTTSNFIVDASSGTLGANWGTPIAAGVVAKFTVRPNEALPAGDYKDEIKVVGSGGASVIVPISFKVQPPRYKIEVSPSTVNFVNLSEGYTHSEAVAISKYVTVTNVGTDQITLTWSSSASSSAFDGVIPPSYINKGGTAAFTLWPKDGLSIGQYNERIKISGNGGEPVYIDVSFTVNKYVALPTIKITTQPKDETYVTDKNVVGTLSVTAESSDPSSKLSYTWYYSESFIRNPDPDSPPAGVAAVPGGSTASIAIPDLKIGSNGSDKTYYFYAVVSGTSNELSKASNVVSVTVTTSPTIAIVKHPESKTVIVGTNYGSLTVDAKVITTSSIPPNPSYQWYETDDPDDEGTMIFGERSASFVIPKNLEAGETHYYYVVVSAIGVGTDVFDDVASSVAAVKVVNQLTFVDKPEFDIPSRVINTGEIDWIDVSVGVSGGIPPYEYAMTGYPNKDIVIDKKTGIISGTPKTEVKNPGTATVTVTDNLGTAKSITIAYGAMTKAGAKLVFVDDPAFDIKSSVVGAEITPVNVSSGVSGGTQPYVFSQNSTLRLPAGINLDPNTGVISGIPIVASAGTARIYVTDYVGARDSIEIAYGAMTAGITIVRSPLSTTLKVGNINSENGKLDVIADIAPTSLRPSLRYQWFRSTDKNGKQGITEIAGANSDYFVVPSDLTKGEYYYFVVVSADGVKDVTSSVAVVTVNNPSITVSKLENFDPTEIPDDPSVSAKWPAAQVVTVTNSGNKDITVDLTLSGNTSSYVVGPLSTNTLAVGKSATFSVRPRTNPQLGIGRYDLAIRVEASDGDFVLLNTSFIVTSESDPIYSVDVNKREFTFNDEREPYKQPGAQVVVIKNTGTGTITLSEPTLDNGYYDIGPLSTWTLAKGAMATFNVRPVVGLVAEDDEATRYDDILTVGCYECDEDVQVDLKFRVLPPLTYRISVSPLSSFGYMTDASYTRPPVAQEVTVTNTGRGKITLRQPTAVKYTITTLSTKSLNEGESATFRVQPKSGLGWGTHDEAIVVSGTGGDEVVSDTLWALFTVAPGPVYTVTLNPNGGTVTTALGNNTLNTSVNGKLTSLPTPKMEGNVFEGWFLETLDGPKVTLSTVFESDATIIASWTPEVSNETSTRAAVTFNAGEHGVLRATVDGGAIATGTLVQKGKTIVLTAVADSGYALVRWTINGVVDANNTAPVYIIPNLNAATVIMASFDVEVSVASNDRVIPASTTLSDREAAIAPVAARTTGLTAGSNVVSRSSGSVVSFYRKGVRVTNATLYVFDASGSVVSKIAVKDNANGQQNRKVGEWDLKDSKGRTVPEGTYLVKGVLRTSGGKAEKVSAVVGVGR